MLYIKYDLECGTVSKLVISACFHSSYIRKSAISKPGFAERLNALTSSRSFVLLSGFKKKSGGIWVFSDGAYSIPLLSSQPFGYDMSENGIVTIKDLWLKKVWEITRRMNDWALNLRTVHTLSLFCQASPEAIPE